MFISKPISHALSASSLLAFALGTSAAYADTTAVGLLNPTLLPQQQGWQVTASVPDQVDVTANGSFITANTIGVVVPGGPADGAVQLFHQAIPILVEDGYAVDFWLKVDAVQTPHDAFDGGVVFYAGTANPAQASFTGAPRAQLIYFDADSIGWGDESGDFPLNTTDDFHHYRVEVDSDGAARVLVDGTLALQRADFKPYARIAFGDMTNSEGLNARFSISSITVSGLLATATSVDVRPTSCPNKLNGKSTRSVPIIIAGRPDFDVNRIDPDSVRVSGLVPKGWSIRDAGRPSTPYIGKTSPSQCTTGGADGRKDLVVAFQERLLAQALNPVSGVPTTLRLTAKLKPEFGGLAIVGEDIVMPFNVPVP